MQDQPESASRTDEEVFSQPMFRAMREDPEGSGWPLVGRSGRTLGVRVDGSNRDIPVAEDGTVSPNTGGMSVALDKAVNLPKPRLPRALGGEGRDPVFRMYSEVLPETMLLRPDRYPHASVEPSKRSPLTDFVSALAGTRNDWSKVHD